MGIMYGCMGIMYGYMGRMVYISVYIIVCLCISIHLSFLPYSLSFPSFFLLANPPQERILT